jgi:acyl-CoA synthetase (NDP forming)
VLIAEQMSDGIDLCWGVHRDPRWGPVILFGAGGVELAHRDVASPRRRWTRMRWP